MDIKKIEINEYNACKESQVIVEMNGFIKKKGEFIKELMDLMIKYEKTERNME